MGNNNTSQTSNKKTTQTKPKTCVKCKRTIPKIDSSEDTLKRTSGKCSKCFEEDQRSREHENEEEMVRKRLSETLQDAKELCSQDRMMEVEKWNRTEVIKDVFQEDRGNRRDKAPCPKDETDAMEKPVDTTWENQGTHSVRKELKRLLSQDWIPDANTLSQVQDLIITKLCRTAMCQPGNEEEDPANVPHLSTVVRAVGLAAGTSTSRQYIFSQVLLDTWEKMEHGQSSGTLLCLSTALQAWTTQESKEISEDRQTKQLTFLEVLLQVLDQLREKKRDETWVNTEKECLRLILDEMGLMSNIACPLLGITGPGCWTGLQALQLLVSLAKRQLTLHDTESLLDLLQRHHVIPTWRAQTGHTVIEMLQAEIQYKEIYQSLKEQLKAKDEDQVKLIEQHNSTQSKPNRAARIVQKVYQNLKTEKPTNPRRWIDNSIPGCLLLVLLGNILEYGGSVFLCGFCAVVCFFTVNAIAWSKRDSQKWAVADKIEQGKQPDHLLGLCRGLLRSKGLSPSYHQMITLFELTYGRRRQPWRFVTVVQDHPCVAAMVTALHAMRSRRVGVLLDSQSHQLEDWKHFYETLDIRSCQSDTTSEQSTFRENMVIYGDLESFISNYLQHWPWVDKEEEQEQILRPQHLVLGGRIPENNLGFHNLSKYSKFIQSTLCTLVKGAGKSTTQQVEIISIILFALTSLSDVRGTSGVKYTPKDKLAAICQQFSTQTIPRKHHSLVRLLEIVLRCVHERQQRNQVARRELPFENQLEMLCFELLLTSAAKACQVDHLQDSLRILSDLVRRELWGPVKALDLFDLLAEKLGKTGNFREKMKTALGRMMPRKHQMNGNSPLTLSSALKVLHLMAVNSVSSSFRDTQGQLLTDFLISSEQGSSLFSELKEILQRDREKSLEDIFEELQQEGNIEDNLCKITKDIVDYVTKVTHGDGCTRETSGTSIKTGASKDPENLKLNLLDLCVAVEATMFLKPRLTQMVSWCLLVLSDTGRLLQLGTGEGKSCVVAMFAAYRATVCGEKVDILSSSTVLAKRDVEQWRPFYEYLNLTVDCNIDITSDEARKKCYESGVVYGTVECFAADCLRQDFEKKDIRPARLFQCIIVDEVDSLLLDKGVQTTYLSKDMPALQHLDIILAMIWSMVCKYEFIPSSDSTPIVRGPLLPFHKALFDTVEVGQEVQLTQVLELAEKEDVIPAGPYDSDEILTEKLKDVSHNEMVRFFHIAERYIPYRFSTYTQDDTGRLTLCSESQEGGVPFLVLDEGHCCSLFDNIDMLYEVVEDGVRSKLNFTQTESKDSNTVQIPGFLQDLVKHKLGLWVRNAFQALEMREREKYIVGKDTIYPVDSKHTGVVERNKKWGDGLQQFLEMKHQTKLSSMCVITNFLSNVTFFKKYKGNIYGTTGTLGNQVEIQSLGTLYHGLLACKIPSFKETKLFEAEGEIVNDVDLWRERICCTVLEQTRKTRYRGGRAALVICETIKEAQIIGNALAKKLQAGEKGMLKIYTDNDTDDVGVTNEELRPGDVIVATNLAGRGTDLQVSSEVKTAGGLFVVLTFLANNKRVEHQAFGRTARQGSPGSAQLVLCSAHFSERVHHDLKSFHGQEKIWLQEAKKACDRVAEEKVTQTLKNDIPTVFQREEIFSKYCSILDRVHSKYKDTDQRNVMVAMLNEYWGLWYLRRSEDIKRQGNKQLMLDLEDQIQNAHEQFQHNNSPYSSIYHYIKFANKLLLKKDYVNSAELYSRAIELDSSWAAIAYYYRANCTYKKGQEEKDINSALDDLNRAKESVDLFICQCQTIQCLLRMYWHDSTLPEPDFVGVEESSETDRQKENKEGTETINNNVESMAERLDQDQAGEPGEQSPGNSLQDQMSARMHVWAFFRNNIERAIKDLKVHTGMEQRDVFALMKSPSMDEHNELHRLHQLGLERVFGARESLRFRWEGLGIICFGVTEVFTGLALGDLGINLLNLDNATGTLSKQGLCDVLKGIRCLTTGEFCWDTWKNEKVVSLAVDLINNVPMEGIQDKIKKKFHLPKESTSLWSETKNTFVCVKTRLMHQIKRTKEEVIQSIEVYGVGEEDRQNMRKICDTVKVSIDEKALNIVKDNLENGPLHILITNMVAIHEPKSGVLISQPLHSTLRRELKQTLMELCKRALESKCTGRNQPEMLASLTKNVGLRVIRTLRKKPENISNTMMREYDAVFKGGAPYALMAVARDFHKEFCRLLEELVDRKKANERHSEPKDTLLKTLQKELEESVSSELSEALYELLQQTLEHQHIELFSSSFRRNLRNAIRDSRRSKLRPGRSLRTSVKGGPRNLQRQNTKDVLEKLKDCPDGVEQVTPF